MDIKTAALIMYGDNPDKAKEIGVKQQIVLDFMQNGLSESAARTVVELIKDEKIEHVRIVY